MDQTEALQLLGEEAALWSIEDAEIREVILLACDALVAGLDTPSLRELAGLPTSSHEWDVGVLLFASLDELGIPHYERNSIEGWIAALRAGATRCLDGRVTPQEFQAWLFHQSDDVDEFGVVEGQEAIKFFSSCYPESPAGKDRRKQDHRVLDACRQFLRR